MKLGKSKLISSYSKPVKNIIRLLSINYDGSKPFGSFSYKDQKYPSDIDLIEVVRDCCTKDKVVNLVEGAIKNMVKLINKSDDTYLGDVKAGIDQPYNIDIGTFINDKLEGYNMDKIIQQIIQLNKKKLLSDEETTKMLLLVKHRPTYDEFQELFNMLRKHFIIRWTDKELLKGYKILPGNRKKLLKDALEDKTKLKVDVWAPINGRYIESTNFIILVEEDKDGNQKLINYDCVDIPSDLRLEIDKLSHKYYFKPFKMVKRMWALARLIKDNDMLEILTPLLGSNIGVFYQISSEIETLILMLETLKKPPLEFMMKQIDEFKARLAYVNDIPFDEPLVDELIDSITKYYKKLDKEKLIELLEHTKMYFKDIINKNTMNYLKKNKLFPPPMEYLP